MSAYTETTIVEGLPPQSGSPSEELVVKGLSKTFGGQRALDNVSVTILHGEVHGLCGQNGSGKSTLIKVLAGFHDPDPGGHLEIGGQVIKLPLVPGEFAALGLSFVHQDLALLPDLTVVENFLARRIATKVNWRIRWGEERKRTEETFARYGLKIDAGEVVGRLRAVERALLAIIRALEDMTDTCGGDLSRGLLVLDEPTVFLPATEKKELFRVVREIVAHGASVLLVTHDLDEALAETDRITVLRDGRVAGTLVSSVTPKDVLVEMMIGSRLAALETSRRSLAASGGESIQVEGVTGRTIKDVSFSMARGEILGASGLVGSGCEELPYLLFGATRAESGKLTIDGVEHDLVKMQPPQAIHAGMALLPGNRADGAVASLPVKDNMMLQVLERYFGLTKVDKRPMYRDSLAAMHEFDVRPPQPNMDFQALSGGNQQKVILAKWFQASPKLLLVHEPTQGVDVGARRQVTEIMKKAAQGGMSVICASSDYEQLAAVCDRVIIFREGERCDELVGDEISKDRIAERCYGSVGLTNQDQNARNKT